MKTLLRRYLEIILAVLAVIFIAAIIAVYVWGINDTVASVNKAVGAKGTAANSTSFDLQGAKQLDLRGLVNTGQ